MLESWLPILVDRETTATLGSLSGHAYRYLLHRSLPGAGSGCAVWIMLNPSTADETTDDPTVRRCVGFGRRWGVAHVLVVNLYAWRTSDPRELWRAPDPVGSGTDTCLRAVLRTAAAQRWLTVCAWGRHARSGRVATVQALLAELGVQPMVLGTTRDGHPRHPLYVPYGVALRPWP